MEDKLNLNNSIYRPNLMMMFHLLYPQVLAQIPPTYIGDVPSVEPPKKKNRVEAIIEPENANENSKEEVVASTSQNSRSAPLSMPSLSSASPTNTTAPALISRPPKRDLKKGPLEFMIVGTTPINLKNNGCYTCKQRFTSFKNLQYHLTTKHQEKLELLRLQIHALKRKRDEEVKADQSKFACVYKGCGKIFSLWNDLMEHAHTHTY